MKLEPNLGSRLDVADTRQHQRRQHLAVSEPFLNATANLFEKLFSWSYLEQLNQRFDPRIQTNQVWIGLGIGC